MRRLERVRRAGQPGTRQLGSGQRAVGVGEVNPEPKPEPENPGRQTTVWANDDDLRTIRSRTSTSLAIDAPTWPLTTQSSATSEYFGAHLEPRLIPMTSTTILNDGRRIPNLASGTGSAHVGQDVTTQVLAALNAGFTHIDTAQWYHNEHMVGKALNEFFNTRKDKTYVNGDVDVDVDVDVENGFYRPKRRETIWVTTKLGNGTDGAVGELHKSLERVMASRSRSLTKNIYSSM